MEFKSKQIQSIMGKESRSWLGRLKKFVLSPHIIQYIKYNVIGGFGVLLNLIITYVLTEFFFGRQKYIYAFAIGTVFNLIYNYVTYVRYVFPFRRLAAER